MPSALTLAADLTRKQQEHGVWLAQFKTADGGYDMTTDQVGEFRKRNAELDELAGAKETQEDIEKSAADVAAKTAPQGRLVKDGDGPETKDQPSGIYTKAGLDAAFRKGFQSSADMLKHIAEGGRGTASFEIGANLKTIVDLTTAYATQPTQVGRAESALFFGDVEPMFPHAPVSSSSVVGYIQTTDTDNAAAVAENTAATDSAFVWTPTTDEVEDIQTWIPASRDLLSDEPQMQGVITGMLAKRLQKKSSGYILTGTGTTPVPWGVFIRTGFQTQAKSTDPTFDAIHKAITKVAVTGDADPNLAVFHPNDWQDIRLTRTTDGLYILGSPTESGPMRIWGLPVVLSTGMTENTGGVVDTSFTTIFENGGVVVEVSTEHSTYFTERKLALSLVRRFAAFHFRPAAAATITGI
jgi:HK97 family phage major capsid protein